MRVQSHAWRAMGCEAVVEIVGGPDHLGDLARSRLAHLERCWSRFLPGSDISRLNAAGGAPIVVDPATVTLLETMVHAWSATGGAFDPTLLVPLVGLGYATGRAEGSFTVPVPPGARPRGDVAGIAVDRAASVAQLPVGTVLDAGGIGKGLAADLVWATLADSGAEGAMVSVGGDLRVAGRGPAGGGWRIAVAAAWDPEHDAAHLVLADGGVATSGVDRTRWVAPDGTPVHHLLDPSLGRPVPEGEGATVQATVVAGTAAWAEAYATLAVVRGHAAAFPVLDELGLAARAIDHGGAAHTNRAWERFGAEVG